MRRRESVTDLLKAVCGAIEEFWAIRERQKRPEHCWMLPKYPEESLEAYQLRLAVTTSRLARGEFPGTFE